MLISRRRHIAAPYICSGLVTIYSVATAGMRRVWNEAGHWETVTLLELADERKIQYSC